MALLAVVSLSLIVHSSWARDCQKSGSVCADSTPCKNINGVIACLQGATLAPGAITISATCWEYKDTYQCLQDDPINNCATIAAIPECAQIGSTCSASAFDGSCMTFNNTYQCSADEGTPAGAVFLRTDRTVASDTVDNSQCQALASDRTCSLAQTTCTSPGGTRTINGLDVTKSCWGWSNTYNCVSNAGQDSCAPLETQTGCSRTSSTCTATAWDGSCLSYAETFDCNEPTTAPLTANLAQVAATFKVTSDTLDTSQCSAYANNAGCTLSGQTCTQGAGTRNINGDLITKDCWAWNYSYTCVGASAQNYCSPLAAAHGCSQSSRTCSATAWDGSCLQYTDDYQCSSQQPTPLPAHVVQLPTTYTSVDTTDASQCVPYAANPACTLASHTCTTPGGTRNINGLDVTEACWGWTDTYSCKGGAGQDYCAPLEQTSGCTAVPSATVCTATAWDGSCLTYQEQFHCSVAEPSPLPPNVQQISATFTITSDTLNTSQCNTYANNPECTLAGKTCTDAGGTRVINGDAITKDCWGWSYSYTCVSPAAANYCAPLNQAGCTQISRTCSASAWDGSCLRYTDDLQCSTQQPAPLPLNVTQLPTQYIIASDTADASQCTALKNNNACTLASHTCTVPGGTRNINGLDVTEACWGWTDTYTCKGGAGQDYCTPLEQSSACTAAGKTCSATAWDGSCLTYTEQFHCTVPEPSPLPPNIQQISATFTVTSDTLNTAQCSAYSNNPQCTLAGKTCSDPGGTRTINGDAITKDCWAWSYNYTCVGAAATNYCTPIAQAPGCTQSSRTCSAKAWDGSCLQYTDDYQCTTQQPTPLPANVTQLPTQYVIASDTIDASQCTSLKNNQACTLASHVCTTQGGTRNINGLNVTKDCWGWTDTYTCKGTTGQDSCTPLEQAKTCTPAGKTCSSTAWDGTCLTYTEQFHCSASAGSPPPPNVTLISSSFTIGQNQLDTSQCAQYASNPNCTQLSDPCTQGAGTRNINGLDVTESCWQYTPTYSCAGPASGNSNCQALENDPTCTQQGTRCVDTLPDGSCGLQDVSYQCMTSPGTSKEVTTCGAGVCMNGVCSGPTTPPSTDFGSVTAAMEAGREMGNYLDPANLQLFKGQSSFCEVKLGGLGNCCAAQGDPGKASNAYLMAGVKLIANQAIKSYGSPYMYDTLYEGNLVSADTMASISGGASTQFGSSASQIANAQQSYSAAQANFSAAGQAYDQAAATYGAESAEASAAQASMQSAGTALVSSGEALETASATMASGSYSAFGITATIGADGSVALAVCVPCIAAIVAIYLIEQWLQCTQSDQMTGMRKSAHLCTYVGSWCSQKVLGSCAAETQSYCCYNSVLARIVEEQGRVQLGKGYGDPKNPDCSGFTEAELAKVNFSAMDLSEFINTITPSTLDTTLATQRVQQGVQARANAANQTATH